MRLGINFTPEHRTPEEWGDILVGMGCRAASFPGNERTPDHLKDAYVKAAKDRDIIIAEVGIWSSPFHPDKAVAKREKERAVEKLRLADEVGARCCVNVSGAFGEEWAGPYAKNFGEKAYQKVVEYVQKLLDKVKPEHTYFTLEPMQWMVPDSPECYAKLIDDIGDKRFAVHLDVCNFIRDPYTYLFKEDLIKRTFNLLARRNIRSCHVKDCLMEKGTTVAIHEVEPGEGTMPLPLYLKKIMQLDPDTPALLEHMDKLEQYQRGMEYLAGLLPL